METCRVPRSTHNPTMQPSMSLRQSGKSPRCCNCPQPSKNPMRSHHDDLTRRELGSALATFGNRLTVSGTYRSEPRLSRCRSRQGTTLHWLPPVRTRTGAELIRASGSYRRESFADGPRRAAGAAWAETGATANAKGISRHSTARGIHMCKIYDTIVYFAHQL